ncbi:MAG TPA: ribonuclease D [Steroidobacteraceae bacterium]|nr:ribonuclease D [Steroidobacteraceae bacterium]
MPEAIWIDTDEEIGALAQRLSTHAHIGVDTEFLRERTFFPKLCLLQIAAGDGLWCVDAMRGRLDPLVPVLTAPACRKLIHAARQDLEALYLTAKCVSTPVFDTQIAAGCVGLKPQIGYAELAYTLLAVTVTKEQTRTDWSRRPLRPEQLAYAADDVRYLQEIAFRLEERARELGRAHWVAEDCAALGDLRLYEPDPQLAWQRLRGIAQLAPEPRARAKAIAVWRERLARDRDLPRAWILGDAAIFDVANANPRSAAGLRALRTIPAAFNERFAEGLLETLREAAQGGATDMQPAQDKRPTDAQAALLERLFGIVDARAAALGVSAEILAPRGDLKTLAAGGRDVHALNGWRRAQIGDLLLESLG